MKIKVSNVGEEGMWPFMDVTEAEELEIRFSRSRNGRTLWVNHQEGCLFRARVSRKGKMRLYLEEGLCKSEID